MTNKQRTVHKLDSNLEWREIQFKDIKAGDRIRLYEPNGDVVAHEDGRTSYIATSDAYSNNLGQQCFEINDELKEIKTS